VITPYRSQVLAIRAALRAVELRDINVGTPEVLQGKERRVVILSSVLSSQCGPSLLNKRQAQAAVLSGLLASPSVGTRTPAPFFTPPTGFPSTILPAGLFYNPRSLNVSMTRAQNLLIFVGDPAMFVKDPSFKVILQTAVNHGTFISTGPPLPPGLQAPSLVSLGL